ncbi:MAG: hypothetical protein A2086_01765 [Spirochaetes bacterium GWD1_27_9]|nr:MAG: hypothetical protein A2Z98_03965 [Spirochaetes bacterium GWB1_27_13]OHD20603.1 MAG: hypothetical protein A2Y34_17445 [Spirochaetes bacterium GWC1_27_15]OHD41830.1 MAG: hypothetical protein A2086_01765 [Spirochaetes bacterium GWD1_27_9]
MKKLLYIFSILFAMCTYSYSESVTNFYVADILVRKPDGQTESIDISYLLKQGLGLLSGKNFKLITVSSIVTESSVVAREKIKNDYVAYEVCDILGLDYLIYGFIDVTDTGFEAEIRIFSRDENKTVFKINREKKNETDLGRFLEELIIDIDSQIYSSIKIEGTKVSFEKKSQEEIKRIKIEEKKDVTPDVVKEKKKFHFTNYIGIYNSLGYYIPIDKYWNLFTGVFSFETGVCGVRIDLYSYKNIILQLRPDILFSYSLAINKEKYTQSFLNSFQIKSSLSIGLNIYKFFDVLVGAGCFAQFDLFYQNYLDKSPYNFTAAFGLNGLIDTNFWLDKNQLVALGLANQFNFTFYTDFFVSYKLYIYTVVRFREKK